MKFSCCLIFAVLSVASLFVSSLIDFGRNQAIAGQRLVSDEPYGDYLASFRKPAADRSATERALFKKLAGCKVPTPEEATGIAFRNVGIPRDAQESIRVAGLIRMARDVTDFANKGDFVWIVRFGFRSGEISDEIWISSTSGAVISVFKGNVKLGADSPNEKAPEVEQGCEAPTIRCRLPHTHCANPGPGHSPNRPSAFGNHWIVQVNGVFYDPSYGIGPVSDPRAYEDLAFSGYIDGALGRLYLAPPDNATAPAGALQPDGSILFEDTDQIAILAAIDPPAWMSL